jgi:hypothetical protein
MYASPLCANHRKSRFSAYALRHALNTYKFTNEFVCFPLKLTSGSTLRKFFTYQHTLLCLLFSWVGKHKVDSNSGGFSGRPLFQARHFNK